MTMKDGSRLSEKSYSTIGSSSSCWYFKKRSLTVHNDVEPVGNLLSRQLLIIHISPLWRLFTHVWNFHMFLCASCCVVHSSITIFWKHWYVLLQTVLVRRCLHQYSSLFMIHNFKFHYYYHKEQQQEQIITTLLLVLLSLPCWWQLTLCTIATTS